MYNIKSVPGTKGSITIENTWYKENSKDKSYVLTGVGFISLIILIKIITLF